MKNQLTPDQLFQYASKGFRFKNLSVFRFDGWSEARHFYKNRRQRQAAMECQTAVKLKEEVASTSTTLQQENKKGGVSSVKESDWKVSKNNGARPGKNLFKNYFLKNLTIGIIFNFCLNLNRII